MQTMRKYLGDLDRLTAESTDGKNDYIHPGLKNTGCLSLVLIREVIAPAVFRNSEQEITDIEFNGQAHVRAVANKFKYLERGRGLQVLRAYGTGGKMPQNRTALKKQQNPSEVFDLNTFVQPTYIDDRASATSSGTNQCKYNFIICTLCRTGSKY